VIALTDLNDPAYLPEIATKLKQELQLHGQCEELALDFLTEEDVAEYLAVRFSVGARGQWKEGQAEAAPLQGTRPAAGPRRHPTGGRQLPDVVAKLVGETAEETARVNCAASERRVTCRRSRS